MRRKLNFTSLFFFKPTNHNETSSSTIGDITATPSSSSTWPWASSCTNNPKTSSFRNNQLFKTVNSIYLDSSSSSELIKNEEEDDEAECYTLIKEAMVFRSESRLFFDPNCCKSICNNNNNEDDDANKKKKSDQGGSVGVPFKESVAMAMESEDPYGDFRRSMEEMVVAHGIREWESLEEMLVWFLRVNGKNNHGFIVGAFVDLLVGNLESGCSSNCSNSIMSVESSSSSSSSSSSVSRCFEIEEVKEERESESEGGSSSSF